MQSSVHSHNFEKCVCLAISVSLMEEPQWHQALLCAEFKVTVLKEFRANLDPIQFYEGSSDGPSSQSSKWTEVLCVISKLGVPKLWVLAGKKLSSLKPHFLAPIISKWCQMTIPDNAMWAKMIWVSSEPSGFSLSFSFIFNYPGTWSTIRQLCQ